MGLPASLRSLDQRALGARFLSGQPLPAGHGLFFREAGKYSFTLEAGDVSGIARLPVRIREWTVASDITGMPYEPGSDDLVFDFSPHNAVQSGQGVTTGDFGNFYSYNEQWLTLERGKLQLQDTLDFSVNSLGRNATVFVYAMDGAGNETMGKVVLAPNSPRVDR